MTVANAIHLLLPIPIVLSLPILLSTVRVPRALFVVARILALLFGILFSAVFVLMLALGSLSLLLKAYAACTLASFVLAPVIPRRSFRRAIARMLLLSLFAVSAVVAICGWVLETGGTAMEHSLLSLQMLILIIMATEVLTFQKRHEEDKTDNKTFEFTSQ